MDPRSTDKIEEESISMELEIKEPQQLLECDRVADSFFVQAEQHSYSCRKTSFYTI